MTVQLKVNNQWIIIHQMVKIAYILYNKVVKGKEKLKKQFNMKKPVFKELKFRLIVASNYWKDDHLNL